MGQAEVVCALTVKKCENLDVDGKHCRILSGKCGFADVIFDIDDAIDAPSYRRKERWYEQYYENISKPIKNTANSD